MPHYCKLFTINQIISMSDQIRLKKGLDLPIAGAALCEVTLRVSPDLVAVKPTDFRGMVPRLLVKEGDSVKAGTPLFSDKKCPEMVFCSPVSGTEKQAFSMAASACKSCAVQIITACFIAVL